MTAKELIEKAVQHKSAWPQHMIGPIEELAYRLAKMLLKAIECLKRANTEDDDKLSYEFDQIANGDMWWKTRLSLFLMQSSGVTGLPEMWVGLKTT